MDNKKLMYKSTIDYYNNNAEEYCAATNNADLSDTYYKFESLLPVHGSILDVGCGSGRDSRHFSNKGYCVTAIDPSNEMCRIAKGIPGISVKNISVSDIDCFEEYDGIWACASLLHISINDMTSVFKRLFNALKPGGVLYASWKYGSTERYDDKGRLFSDFNEDSINTILEQFPNIILENCWISDDVMNRSNQLWLNILVRKPK